MESNVEKVRFKTDADGYINDVDVEPGVDTVEIAGNMNIKRDTQKSFPGVTKLVINEDVVVINIPNSLFPNVKTVISNSKRFKSGVPYLLRQSGTTYAYTVLNNTFFHDKEEPITLNYVHEISNYAFTGCESLKVIINGYTPTCCCEKAFAGSAFERQPFVNGIKMAGPFVIAVDEKADVIEFPDGESEDFRYIATDISKVKHMIVHRPETLMYYYIKSLPEWLTLDAIRKVNPDEIEQLMHCTKANGKHVKRIKRFDISDKTAKESGLMQDGGVIYTEDQKVLISCMTDVEHVKIPDGVETIEKNAFRRSRIKFIDIPDSVVTIKHSAFEYCECLESVNFGKGLRKIGQNAFQFCTNLKSVDIPGNVKSIDRNAFCASGLEKIRLSEGVTEVKSELINHTYVKEITLPSSLEDIDYWSLDNERLQKVFFHKYNPKIISAIASNGYLRVNDTQSICIEIICGEKRMYVPRNIKPNMSKTIRSLALTLFDDTNPLNHISSFQCAYSKEGREHIAVLEYINYQDEEAKEYLKKRASKMLPRLIEEENEDFVVQFLKLGLISKVTLKKALKQAEDLEKVTVKSYIMQELGDFGVTKQNFYI